MRHSISSIRRPVIKEKREDNILGNQVKQAPDDKRKKAAAFCLILYLAILLYFLLIAERGFSLGGYNVIPFAEIRRYLKYRNMLGTRLVLLNLGGNILGFIPFGGLLPVLGPGFRHFWTVTGRCFGASLIIELTQLLTCVGCFDVDDILMNTLGGSLGYGIWALSVYLRRR